MLLLDAVNLILPKLGEHRVTRLDIKHPTLAVILPEVENELRKLLSRGWWFNEFDYTAYPDSEKHIALGIDTISFTALYADTAVQRGNKLFNPVTLSYDFDEPVKGRARMYVPFDELPESAAQTVYYSGLTNAYITDIGLTQEVQTWGAQAAASYSDLLSEHLRQKKYNTRQSRKFRKLVCALRG
jgi:hypothetical protein